MVSSRSVEFNTFPFLLSLGAEAETSVVFVFMAFVDSFLVEDFDDDDDDDGDIDGGDDDDHDDDNNPDDVHGKVHDD